jgi:hypothetical protein
VPTTIEGFYFSNSYSNKYLWCEVEQGYPSPHSHNPEDLTHLTHLCCCRSSFLTSGRRSPLPRHNLTGCRPCSVPPRLAKSHQRRARACRILRSCTSCACAEVAACRWHRYCVLLLLFCCCQWLKATTRRRLVHCN